MPTPHELLFARFAVEYGLLTDAEVERCWRELEAARANARDALRGATDATANDPIDFPRMAQRLELLSPYQAAGIDVLLREQGRVRAAGDTACGDSSAPSQPSESLAPPNAAAVAAPLGTVVAPDSPTCADASRPASPAARPATPPPRAMLGGYTILRELGRGGMGIVYEAIQLKLNRRVALKVMASTRIDPEGLERTKREALAAAKLTHANVVRIYDFGDEEGRPYFAMEYVEGTSIAGLIGRPELTRERAVRLALQAAEGLHAAHEAGILHRDIKPANLLVGAGDRVVVTDFGLARDQAAATITQSNQVLGTPRYMSPEQANGVRDEVDRRTDVYSLGATLYEMATGKPIFEEKDGHLLQQVLFREPKPPRKHDSAVSEDLETVILKATAKEPSRRYATAAELAEDLRRLCEGQPVLARRAGWTERLGRLVLRHRRLVAGLAAAGVIVTVLVGVLAERVRERGRAAEAERHSKEALELVRQARESTRRVEISVAPGAGPEEIEAAAADARGRFAAASEALARATELDPGNAVVLGARTMHFLRMGDPVNALVVIAKWQQVAVDGEWVSYVRARALQESFRESEALQDLGRLSLNAKNPIILALARARKAILERNPEDALQALKPVTQVEGDWTEPYRLRAQAVGLGSGAIARESAVRIMEEAQTWGSTFSDTLTIARWMRELGRQRESEYGFVRALAHTLSPGCTYLELATLHGQFGEDDLAERMFDYAAKLLPESYLPQLYRGELKRKKGDLESAFNDYRLALGRAPGSVSICARLLSLCAKLPNSPQTVEFLSEWSGMIATIGANSTVEDSAEYCDLVDALLDLGRQEDAVCCLQKAESLFPTVTGVEYLRGRLLHQQGDFAGAVAKFEGVLARSRGMVKALVWKSRSQAALGDLRGSIESLLAASRLEPENRDLHLKRSLRRFHALDVVGGLKDMERVVLMSSAREIEQLREQLLSGSGADWSEKLPPQVRELCGQLMPRLGQSLCHRGERLLERGDLENAESAFERSRLIDPSQWRPVLGLASVSVSREDWEVAGYRVMKALDLGFTDIDQLEHDERFAAWRNRPEYAEFKDRIHQRR